MTVTIKTGVHNPIRLTVHAEGGVSVDQWAAGIGWVVAPDDAMTDEQVADAVQDAIARLQAARV